MPEHAYRTCPHCGTHNRHYMLVCTRCTRSLQGVALVGTPPPGSEIGGSSDRLLRITLGALALLAAATVAVLLSRLLRTGAVEGRASAASVDAEDRSRPPSPPAAAPLGAWETLEERWADRPGIPAPSASATAAVPATLVVPASAPPATPAQILSPPPAVPLTIVPPSTAPAAPPATVPVPAAASPVTATATAPVEASDTAPAPRSRATPRVPMVPSEPEADTGDDVDDDESEVTAGRARPLTDPATDPERARSERRAALRRAEERLRRLERRAEELRDRIAEEDDYAEPGENDTRRLELTKVLRRIEQADREVIRAEWALREVEQ